MARDLAHRQKMESRGSGAVPPAKGHGPVGDPTETPGEPWDDGELDIVPLRQKLGGRRSEKARRYADRLRGGPVTGRAGATVTALEQPALVVATARGPCEVELADGTHAFAHLPKALARAARSEITVGDRVLLARRTSGELAVAQRLPRTSRLSRPDPFLAHRERVLTANLDLAVVVASVRHPELATGLIDRFLVALAHGGVPAILAVNKIDLAREASAADAELARLEPYRSLELSIVLCSARTGRGLDELRAAIAGKMVAFVGHSGVGKSSLLNALAPEANAAVGDVSPTSSRGRHTTTGARVYRLDDDTRIVDTPGLREFGLWRMNSGELAAYFEEFDAVAGDCRYSNCAHRAEPDCAVRAAAEAGEIAPERYATYLRVLKSLDLS